MRKIGIVLAIVLVAGPAMASDETDMLATIAKYNDAFNKGDANSANALCTKSAIIIDDFAPHAWPGPAACATWWNALASDNIKNGVTDEIVTRDKPWRVTVTGDHGYAVFPAHYTYKSKGKTVSATAVWTFAMQKGASGWRIAGWAWAQR